MPEINWQADEQTGEVVVKTNFVPDHATFWQAHNPKHRDFRINANRLARYRGEYMVRNDLLGQQCDESSGCEYHLPSLAGDSGCYVRLLTFNLTDPQTGDQYKLSPPAFMYPVAPTASCNPSDG